MVHKYTSPYPPLPIICFFSISIELKSLFLATLLVMHVTIFSPVNSSPQSEPHPDEDLVAHESHESPASEYYSGRYLLSSSTTVSYFKGAVTTFYEIVVSKGRSLISFLSIVILTPLTISNSSVSAFLFT